MNHKNIRTRLREHINNRRRKKSNSSFARKLTGMTLCVAIAAIILSTVVCVYALRFVHNEAETESIKFGREAAQKSRVALRDSFRNNVKNTVCDRANIAGVKFYTYMEDAEYLAAYAEEILQEPGKFTRKDIVWGDGLPLGYDSMFLTLCDENIDYDEKNQAKAGILSNIEYICRSISGRHPEITALYIATEEGLLLTYDEKVSSTEQGIANTKYYDFKDTGWYQLGKESPDPVFTEHYKDGLGRGDVITCVAPFHYKNGEYAGCVALDVSTEEIFSDIVSKGMNESDLAILLDNQGAVLAETGKVYTEDEQDMTIGSVNYPGLYGLNEIIGKYAKSGALFSTDPETREEYLFAYSDIDYVNLRLVIQSPLSSVMGPINSIENEIDQNTGLMNQTIETTIESVLVTCFLLFFILSIISMYIAGKVSYNLSEPLKVLTDDMKKISLGNFGHRTLVNTNDEIGSLAVSFNNMAESLGKYQADLKEAISREERTATELSLATDIQAHMLPVDFEDFTKGQNFDLYATMTPAKEVAGDFYDFFRIDDDNIVLVMADVSGKGIPAALFMMISKILIKTNAFPGISPSEVFRTVNDQLCDNNKEDMFVTAWLAKIDTKTGKVTAVNAGHEYPALKGPAESFELMEDDHGLPLGAMEGSKYKEYEFCLKAGGSLFTYTDGVPESTNAEDEQFGTNRMLEALNIDPGADPGKILRAVKEKIDLFVGDSEQFDDITMLGFSYRGNSTEQDDSQDAVI
ncbi:sigma-B regulation protein RsbU (phosphoserine phosphatase) [Oribacterium sp. KHPX15]|uniref:SpoIIE family protein phosphatase n=1 Tax=Oribacterium sp. KHPX15 TaxID=1855342 RepID=UPI00089B753F|nr:SpoIIE family protein phosphatase [Oribacterium sp. KHPX15]SEA54813.1 sigma-B regulation protein RsbU (phosphoserine phosphatase) [Oribacterium sp. KHPX15]